MEGNNIQKKKIGLLISILGLIVGIFGAIGTIMDSFFGYSIVAVYHTLLILSMPICFTGLTIVLYELSKKLQ